MKTCSTCSKSLPDDAFYAKYNQCKVCRKKKADERRERLKALGSCPRCRKPTGDGKHVLCASCQEYGKFYYRQKHGLSERDKILQGAPPGTRYCTTCEDYLPLEEFHASDNRGVTRCARCKAKKVAEYHQRLKEDRRCYHCRVPLEEDDESLCDLCRARARKRYHENGDERRAGNRERKRRLKALVFDAYGGPKCVCCGEETLDFLSIDHINDDGADHRRKLKERHGYTMDMYRWLKNHNFPEGFQVLCFNCNFAKGHFGICPHEVERRRANMRTVRSNL